MLWGVNKTAGPGGGECGDLYLWDSAWGVERCSLLGPEGSLAAVLCSILLDEVQSWLCVCTGTPAADHS